MGQTSVKTLDDVVQSISNGMKPLEEEMSVWRYMGEDISYFTENLQTELTPAGKEIQTFVDDAFTSTSKLRSVAKMMEEFHDGWIANIKLPAGTLAVDVDEELKEVVEQLNKGEEEILLAKFRN